MSGPAMGALTSVGVPHVLREYALLADGERGVLLSPRGDYTWMCFPRWDSDACFATLIGGQGTYAVTPQVPSAEDDVANEFKANSCPGVVEDNSCKNIPTPPNATWVVNFVYGCGVDGAQLDKVESLADPKFVPIPYSTVTLSGKGFCPGMTVDFGNKLAETTVTDKDGTDIYDTGHKAFAVVARLATTGTVTVTTGGKKATLDDVAIDSFRNVNGFNFANFAGTLTPAMFEHVFGVANTTRLILVNTCALPLRCLVQEEAMTPQAANAFAVIAAKFGGGDCFGFSLAAARMSTGGDLTPADLGQDVDSAWKIQRNANIVNFLDEQQLTQYSVQVWSLISAAQQEAANENGPWLLGEISSDIGAGPTSGQYGNGALVLIWSGGQGHAVLAYNVEKDGPGPDVGLDNGEVDVYDPNTPFLAQEDWYGVLHQGRTDPSRIMINPAGTWSFPGLGWTGGPSDIAVLPYNEVAAALTAGLSFSNPNAANVTPAPGTVIDSLTAPDGKAVSLTKGGQGVTFNPPLVGKGPPQQVFSGPLGAYEERLSGKGPLAETVQGPGLQLTVNASGGTDDVVIDTSTATISVGPASEGAPSKTASVTVDQDTPDGGVQSATVTGSPGAGRFTLAFTPNAFATVTGSAHRPRSLALSLTNQVTGQLRQRFSAALTVPAGNTATLNPTNWAEFTGGSLTAAVAPPGKAPKDEVLQDRAQAQAEPTVRHLRIAGHTLLVALSLPALPPGSTLSVTTTFVSGSKIQHRVRTAVTHLGHASARTLRVHIPGGLPAGSAASAVLVAVTTGTTPAVVTSTATAKL